MIADALRIEIENHAQRVRESNPLLLEAALGSVRPQVLGRYLSSLRFMIAATHPNMARARALAAARGDNPLVDYYDKKLDEEVGHEVWADEDLSAFRNAFGVDPSAPVPACVDLVRHLSASIEADPRLYLAYILWAEYFTVIAGGELVRMMVERCGVPQDVLTCLAKHVKLDADHTEDNLATIDELIDDPALLPALRRTMLTAIAWFDLACEQMAAHEETRVAV